MKTALDILHQGLKELGIEAGKDLLDSFTQYLKELKKWNQAHNLTGLKTDKDIIIKHFLDSILFLSVLPPSVHSVADIGSGAGFPGIPMKLVRPDIKMYLIEPSLKKTVFLRHICHILSLRDCTVIDRSLELVEELRVDAVVTRALFAIDQFVEKAQKLLSTQGVFILNKGPKIREELRKEQKYQVSVLPVFLPILNIERNMIIVRP